MVAANMLYCCCCAAILVNCSVGMWTRICYVIGFENIRIHSSTCYRIRWGFICSHSGERIKKCPDSLSNSPDACGRQPYPERKSCGFKNIRVLVDGAWVANSRHLYNLGKVVLLITWSHRTVNQEVNLYFRQKREAAISLPSFVFFNIFFLKK